MIICHSTCCQAQKAECFSKLKDLLTSILPHVPAKRPEILISEMYTAHRVLCERHVGLVMRDMSPEEVELYSNCPLQMEEVETLPSGFYQRVGLHTHVNWYWRLLCLV